MSRITATLALSFAALASTVTAAPAVSAVSPAVHGDHLTVTVKDSGDPSRDGTYELYCHPAAGDHPDPSGACETLEKATRWGKDPFAPVPRDSACTKQYGGPATAHVTGRWAGRPVDARYDRTDGCQISRWNDMEPLLPSTSSIR
ncbi:SSI family serine proteinase inhibitor [Streptomyces sp. NPDC048172]|uniref:SSI family serine proteinase inhibitor n=1 Tax=Streptomyces sp. NPDC048172 TaxID=3365505 RepID=UPI00371CB575